MAIKEIVRAYLDGFRRGDVSQAMACLHDNVVWRLHGCNTFIGKEACRANIDNEDFREMPCLEIRELIQEGSRVVAIGAGAVPTEAGALRYFTFCEVFLFEGEHIAEVDTFHVWRE